MMKVRLDFCDFMPGYQKTDNFFYHLLRERFDVQICDNPDFLIFADIGQHVHRVHNCVKIHFCVENFAPDFTLCDYAFTCHQMDDPRNLRLPYYALRNPQDLLKDNEDLEQIMASKTKFCSFLASYANNKTRVRNEFFHKLCKYKKVDSAGGALNNMGCRLPAGPKAKIEFLRPYKFNLAFENASLSEYTTEKIVDAMEARAMPLYWGNPDVGREFNSKSFLNYFDFPSEEALIEKIIELDQDDVKYMEYLREPYFHNNQPNEFFSRERLLNQFEKIFTTPITPVSARRYRLQIGRWIPVLKNRPPTPL
jgi:alpha(1,3/1,4) fucosyltransferase